MTNTPFFPLSQSNAQASDPIQTHSPAQPGPLDPDVVYNQTRPSDWLIMPAVSNVPGNLYALVLIPQGAQVKFPLMISSSPVRIEFGHTDSSGSFVSTRVVSESAAGTVEYTIDASDFSHLTSDGHVQCMVRISYQSGQPAIYFTRPAGDSSLSWISPVREIAANVCNISLGGYITALKHMRYFTGYGFVPPFFMFKDNISLIAVRHLDTEGWNDASMAFCGCISLIAIPNLDFSDVYQIDEMFKGCISLEYLPAMDVTNCWSVQSLFEGCSALKELPEMDTSAVQDFRSFMKGCISIKTIEELDTSNGTDFEEMFSGCISLREIPSIDTSKAVSMTDLFKSCHALATVPALHTERLYDVDLFEDSGITALVGLSVSSRTQSLSFENMKALTRVTLSCNGWDGCDISFAGTCLSREAYVEFFQSLPVIISPYTITLGDILGGANMLRAEDRRIATDKGWVLD